ncbi:M23 family metallopeptidase [Pseudalkalibacillus decolorationis]|uniref:M23 family metallopeptidase n=1 Tax=Pseudalkalibacillus decolorationis TaxID=163879 RepID=UPI002147F980|nr:M23 family metallopeptidase [Pseudalkalibacillus decolorationis]
MLTTDVSAKSKYQKEDVDRFALYHKIEAITSVPWYYLAAVDQYERSIRKTQKDLPEEKGLVGIYYSPRQWVGPLNPNLNDTNPATIALFEGIGLDGNGDGKAERENDEDVLYTFAHYLQSYGFDEENLKIGLWEYYQRDKTVDIILGMAKVYKEYQTLSLNERAFPVPLNANYSYRNTWGDRRGFGGLRIHEGTDIFADYGVPVRATTYGVVEVAGWNRFGGWRVGIRDLNNVYHYYAHLKGFEKGIGKGSVVKPGQVIGYVGSSGYGPPGTQGKFPPHLHYGMYRDNGFSEWSFDPYPYLRAWERLERIKNRK